VPTTVASTTTRDSSSSVDVEEGELDSVLDSILEEVIHDAGVAPTEAPVSEGHTKVPDVLVEVSIHSFEYTRDLPVLERKLPRRECYRRLQW
jgi:hypothetical protein